ncbi:transposase [Streptomyces sp. NBC_01210]|uniref:transposase n=1 Tax=Streptomyces sp. NBC_01210 TaxID=2903774 RepID=UPI002E13D867|nr:transposase [Streptomyces sp. NBC_01210]
MTDAQWAVIRDALPVPAWLEGRGGQPEGYCHRQMLDAVFYVTDNGVKWRSVPADFPAWDRVYAFFRRWRKNGLVKEIDPATGTLAASASGTGSCTPGAGASAASSPAAMASANSARAITRRSNTISAAPNSAKTRSASACNSSTRTRATASPLFQQTHHRRHRRLRIVETEQDVRTLPRRHRNHACTAETHRSRPE